MSGIKETLTGMCFKAKIFPSYYRIISVSDHATIDFEFIQLSEIGNRNYNLKLAKYSERESQSIISFLEYEIIDKEVFEKIKSEYLGKAVAE